MPLRGQSPSIKVVSYATEVVNFSSTSKKHTVSEGGDRGGVFAVGRTNFSPGTVIDYKPVPLSETVGLVSLLLANRRSTGAGEESTVHSGKEREKKRENKVLIS